MYSRTTTTDLQLPASVNEAANAHWMEHQKSIWKRTDRLLAGLLLFEWTTCVILAAFRSPHTWEGATSSIHPHVWAAMFLGLAIISLPVVLAARYAGRAITRHTIAAGQMLMSGLLIHIGDGRIEMHFHIFGSLAFIAFYRDWRVLITASVVVAMDHLTRGLYMPASVYGVLSPTLWRTFEHAGWVVFEDIFLIGSCMQSVREMHGIAVNRALLERSYHDVERQVAERTAELKNAQEDLMKAARSAGMAEIATSVLHNVGNVLNSVNVSATLVTDRVRQSEVASLVKVSGMIAAHQPDLASYLTEDTRGKLIPGFITELATCLGEEQQAVLAEVESLSKGIEHIKRIVAAQQSMAKTSQVCTKVKPASLLETAISMQNASSDANVEIHKRIVDCPEVMLDQHKVLQILINLISNARHAVLAQPNNKRRITLSIEPVETPEGNRVRFAVADNGMRDCRRKISRRESSRTALQPRMTDMASVCTAAANAAREMGGTLSASGAKGSTREPLFTLEIPIRNQFEAGNSNARSLNNDGPQNPDDRRQRCDPHRFSKDPRARCGCRIKRSWLRHQGSACSVRDDEAAAPAQAKVRFEVGFRSAG